MAHSIARLQIKIPLFSQIKELKILWYAILEYLKSLWQWYIKSGTVILNVHEDLMAPLVWWGQGLVRFPFFMSWRIVLEIQFIQVIILLGICYPQLVFGLGFTFIRVLSEKFNWRREIRSTGGSDACIRDSFLECLFLCSNWRKIWFAVDWIEFYSFRLDRVLFFEFGEKISYCETESLPKVPSDSCPVVFENYPFSWDLLPWGSRIRG